MVESLVSLLILVLIVGVVVGLALWAIGELGVPDPFARIARVLIVVIACLIVIFAALPMAGVSV